MDKVSSLESLQTQIRRFCEERDWDQFHGAKDLAIGIVTEAGELLEHFRFQSPEQVERLFVSAESRREIVAELADVLMFVLRLADRYAIDLEDAVRTKLRENAKRYPVAQSRGRNQKAVRETE